MAVLDAVLTKLPDVMTYLFGGSITASDLIECMASGSQSYLHDVLGSFPYIPVAFTPSDSDVIRIVPDSDNSFTMTSPITDNKGIYQVYCFTPSENMTVETSALAVGPGGFYYLSCSLRSRWNTRIWQYSNTPLFAGYTYYFVVYSSSSLSGYTDYTVSFTFSPVSLSSGTVVD